MRVLIDAHMLGLNETGNETYVRELLGQTAYLKSQNIEMIAAVRKPLAATAEFIAVGKLAIDIHRLAYLLPKLAAETKADLVHVTYHGPLLMSVPMVVTIHDVSYRLRPQYQSLRNYVLQNSLGYLSARRARLLVTVSQFCRSEIARVYPFASNRIAVTYESSELPKLSADQIMMRLERMQMAGIRFVLSVGRFQPRKNFKRLARSFLVATADAPKTQLVLAGDCDNAYGTAFRKEFRDEISQGRIRLLQYVEPADLAALYSTCACFAFPSLYEGFGLPILEAMCASAPVVASVITAIPEVVGGAGILVDPFDEMAIAAALKQVLGNSDLANELSARARARSKEFSGERFAGATADAYWRAANRTR